MNPLAIAGIVALGLSLAANVFLGKEYLAQRDKATTATVETQQATTIAVVCSKGTDALVTKAAENKAAAAPKREAANKQAEVHNAKADAILATPPAAPGDACKSAEALVDDWWKARKP